MAVKKAKKKASTKKKTYTKLSKTGLAKESKTYANSRIKLKKFAALRKKYGLAAAKRIVKAAHKLKEKHGKSTKKGGTRKSARPAYQGLKKRKSTAKKKKKSGGRVSQGKKMSAKNQRAANAVMRSSKASALKTACRKFFKTAKSKKMKSKRTGKMVTVSAWSQWVSKCSKLSPGGGVALAAKVAKAAKCGPYAK